MIRPALAALVSVALLGLAVGCSTTPTAPPSASAAPTSASPSPGTASGSASGSPTPAGALVLDIVLAGGSVTPNGDKYDVTVGQTVILNVTSDHDDEIHVHSEPEVELEVTAGQPASTRFVAQQSGSFEVEAHHPEKIIAILNVR